MKPRRPRSRPTSTPTAPLDQQAIDARYGLEPVFEPQGSTSASADGGTQFTTVECPYCGEPFDTAVDLSAGSTSYIEDCQICCRPIELGIEISVNGELDSVSARRTD
jgi:Cysteine-rich CPXCG